MPRGQDRVTNAQDKALETISRVNTIESDEEKDEVTFATAPVVNLPAPQVVPHDTTQKKKQAPVRLYWDKIGGEDFFEYINSISPEERATARLQFFSVNQDGSIGGMVHQIVGGWEDLDEGWIRNQALLGVGKYKVGLRFPGKNGRKNDNTIVQIGSDDEIIKQGLIKQGLSKEGGVGTASELHGVSKGIDAFASATEKGMGFLEKSYEKAIERAQSGSDPVQMAKAMAELIKPSGPSLDIPALITALAGLNKKEDGDSALVKMLEAQKADADKRADREKADAEARVQREVTAANERQTRDQQFFQMIMKQNEDRAADKDKFFEILLKEKDKKEDSFGMGDVLKELFKAFAQERLEGGGDTTLPGWAGVVQTALPKVADAVSTFMAVRAGASPQQIQQLQAAQNQNAQTEHGPNGGISNPAPIAPIVSADQQLVDFINRLGNYVSTHENPDPGYMLTVINEEYGPIEDWIYRTPQDQIIAMLQNNTLGQRLLAIPNAPPFIEQLIAGIKQPDGSEDQEPPIIPATAQQYSVEGPSKPKKRKQSAAN